MTKVALLSSGQPPWSRIAPGLVKLADFGAQVTVVCMRPKGHQKEITGPYAIHHLYPYREVLGSGPRRWLLLARNKLVRIGARRLRGISRTWYLVRHDPVASVIFHSADMMIALDPAAIYPVWRMARRMRRATALQGLDAALQLFDGRAADAAAPRIS